MDVIDDLYKLMDDGDYTIENIFDIENDGIGPYEYWGYKGFDAGSDYVCGTCTIVFDYTPKDTDDDLLDEFCTLTSEIEEYCEFYGDDPEIMEITWAVPKEGSNKGKLVVEVDYQENPPVNEPDWDDYDL